MHALLTPDAFGTVFAPLVGQRVGYVRPIGNVGDRLIELAMTQLFARFGIAWRLVDPTAPPPTDVDLLVFGGGGNMGTLYRNNYELRTRALALGLPLVVLPQSFTTPENRGFTRVHVRERGSLALHPAGILAPDLALGLDWPPPPPPDRDLGLFLRRDGDAARPDGGNEGREGAGREHAVTVGEQQPLGLRRGHPLVATLRQPEAVVRVAGDRHAEAHLPRKRDDNLPREVAGSVVSDHDLDPLGNVPLRGDRLEAAPQVRRSFECRYQHRQVRPASARPRTTVPPRPRHDRRHCPTASRMKEDHCPWQDRRLRRPRMSRPAGS